MKTIHIGRYNGGLPAKTTQYQIGWVTRSYLDTGTVLSEAEAFKLLGEAMDHYEEMGRAIQNLRSLIGVNAG